MDAPFRNCRATLRLSERLDLQVLDDTSYTLREVFAGSNFMAPRTLQTLVVFPAGAFGERFARSAGTGPSVQQCDGITSTA